MHRSSKDSAGSAESPVGSCQTEKLNVIISPFGWLVYYIIIRREIIYTSGDLLVICFFGEYLESLWMLYRGRSSLNWELSIFLLCCTGARSFLA